MAIYSREQRAALLWKILLCFWRSLPGLCQWIFLALGFTSSWEHLPLAAMPARSLWAHFSWQWGFVIRSALKYWGQNHGAAGGGNVHWEVYVCAMLMCQCKWKGAGSVKGKAASFTLCPVPGTCIRQVLSHTSEKCFLTPLSTRGNRRF